MRIYCDASILVARVAREDAHAQAAERIDGYVAGGGLLVSSELASLEVHRAFTRRAATDPLDPRWPDRSEAALDDVILMSLDRSVIDMARQIPGAHLGSLDAIHIATALMVEADIVLTRDRRMAEACEAVGLAVA